MYSGFDVNSFCDNLADDFGVFDDLAESLDFRSVGINADAPAEEQVVAVAKAAPKTAKGKRGRKPGQKPRCGACGTLGHTRRTCGS